MSFTHETLYTGEADHYVWHRDTGNLVIVVIDEKCKYATHDSSTGLAGHWTILPLLREFACKWEETRAIGFFQLMDTVDCADEVLELIQEWLDKVTTTDTRVRFLIDALHGVVSVVASNHIVAKLTQSYPQDHIAYLTLAGLPAFVELLPGYEIFQAVQQADYILGRRQRNLRPDKFRPDLMRFLGI